MTSSALPADQQVTARPWLDSLFGDVWPETDPTGRPRLVVTAAAVGLAGAVVLPFRDHGLGTFLVLAGIAGVAAWHDRRLRTPYHLVVGVLCALLIATLLVRDAEWIVALCLLAAFALGVTTLAGGRSVVGLLASGLAVPLAGLRGLPWLGRSMAVPGAFSGAAAVLRTALVSALLVAVFGVVFASADAVFATWVERLVPDLTFEALPGRFVVLLLVAGLTLAGAYIALNPPNVERLAVPPATPVQRAFEWWVPTVLVAAVFAVFVAAQLSVMFGGHDYVQRTTGLTYADYVHQGFAQLTLATVLTLGVVAAVARKAPRATARDRLALRVLLGLLCLLTLVVVASALYRMGVYEDAYGLTRLRLLVATFEGWLGVVVVLVMVAGIRLRGNWVPRAALLTGAASLLLLAVINPDAYIARQAVERYQDTGKADLAYVSGLSADAAGTIARLDPAVACPMLSGSDDDWLEWNLGRSRAEDVLRESCNR